MAGILAAGYAPSVLPSGIIMPIRKLWTPPRITTATITISVRNEFIYLLSDDGKYLMQKVGTNEWKFASPPGGMKVYGITYDDYASE